MRRITAALVALALAGTLAGCSNKEKDPDREACYSYDNAVGFGKADNADLLYSIMGGDNEPADKDLQIWAAGLLSDPANPTFSKRFIARCEQLNAERHWE